MTDKVKYALLHLCGVKAGDHVTIAVSGGKDSLVLTTLLLSLREELGLTLSAVHVHHGLRAASDEEEQFVRRFCEKHGLPLSVHHLHLDAHKGASLEMAAREARYAVFGEYIHPGHFVATAHHLDDCMETFLINLCRGCGSRGLASIPYAREGIIRPLLDVSAQSIKEFALAHNMEWREDASNEDTYYLRNFMRHEILPRLKERTDVCFEKGFETTLQNLRAEADLLDDISLCDSADAAALSALPEPVLWRVLKGRCPELSRKRFECIAARLGKGDFKEQIEKNIYCQVRGGKLSFERKEAFDPIEKTPLGEKTLLKGKAVQIQEIHSQFTHFDIDCDTIGDNLFARTRLQGDRFFPRGMAGSKTVGTLFSEYHIADRDSRLLITDEKDHILFIEGFGADRDHAAGKDTKRALRITITPRKAEKGEK